MTLALYGPRASLKVERPHKFLEKTCLRAQLLCNHEYITKFPKARKEMSNELI